MPMTIAMTFTDILASFKTLGFSVGIVTALLVIIILHVWWLIRRCKRSRQCVSISDANGGDFKLSYSAIRSQLTHKLKRLFPELSIVKIILEQKKSGLKMTLKAQTSELANIKALRSTVRNAIDHILVDEDGFVDVFTSIDVVIIDINTKVPKSQGAPALAIADEVSVAARNAPPLPSIPDPVPPGGEAPAEP